MEEIQKGIHYRVGSRITHAGCEVLPEGKEIPYIVIEKIEFKETEEIAGRKENGVWVATFAPNPYTKLPMILNATNKKRLAKLAKNDMINLVKNFPVRLCSEECKDANDGGMTRGLRISKLPATIPATATTNTQGPAKKILDDAQMSAAIKFLETKTMAELEQYYTISEEMRTLLLKKE